MTGEYIKHKTSRLLVFWGDRKQIQRNSMMLGFVVAIFLFISLIPNIANAAWYDFLFEGIAHIILWIVSLLGRLVIALIQILLAVISYNDFINVPAVVKAWVVVRDVFNLVFILVMMLIAIGTITGASFLKQYSGQQMVFKLLVAAVLVNFSRLLCGIAIDFSHIVTMLFYNGFKDSAAGNFSSGLGVYQMLAQRDASDIAVGGGEIMIAAILALILVFIAGITIISVLVIFIERIIGLWILIIFSPAYVIGNAIPGAQGQAKNWMKKFTGYLTIGPMVSFLLWFALYMMNGFSASGTESGSMASSVGLQQQAGEGGALVGGAVWVGNTAISSAANLLNYIISIGILLAITKVARSSSAMSAKLSGKIFDNLKKRGVDLSKRMGKGAWNKTGGAMGHAANRAFVKPLVARATGIPFIGGAFDGLYKKLHAIEKKRDDERKKRAEGLSPQAQSRELRSRWSRLKANPQDALKGLGARGQAWQGSTSRVMRFLGRRASGLSTSRTIERLGSKGEKDYRKAIETDNPAAYMKIGKYRDISKQTADYEKMRTGVRAMKSHDFNELPVEVIQEMIGKAIAAKKKWNDVSNPDNLFRADQLSRVQGKLPSRSLKSNLVDFFKAKGGASTLNKRTVEENFNELKRELEMPRPNAQGLNNPWLTNDQIAYLEQPEDIQDEGLARTMAGSIRHSLEGKTLFDGHADAIPIASSTFGDIFKGEALNYFNGERAGDKKFETMNREMEGIESIADLAKREVEARRVTRRARGRRYLGFSQARDTVLDGNEEEQAVSVNQSPELVNRDTAQEKQLITGAGSIIRRAKKGTDQSAMTIGAGFADLEQGLRQAGIVDDLVDPSKAGVNIQQQDIQKLKPKLMNMLQTQGMSVEDMALFEQALDQAGSLHIMNKDILGSLSDQKAIISHEKIHDIIDSYEAALFGIWDTMSNQAKEAALNTMQGMGYSFDMSNADSQKEIAHEYFSQGISNATRYKLRNNQGDIQGIQFDNDTKAVVARATGLQAETTIGEDGNEYLGDFYNTGHVYRQAVGIPAQSRFEQEAEQEIEEKDEALKPSGGTTMPADPNLLDKETYNQGVQALARTMERIASRQMESFEVQATQTTRQAGILSAMAGNLEQTRTDAKRARDFKLRQDYNASLRQSSPSTTTSSGEVRTPSQPQAQKTESNPTQEAVNQQNIGALNLPT